MLFLAYNLYTICSINNDDKHCQFRLVRNFLEGGVGERRVDGEGREKCGRGTGEGKGVEGEEKRVEMFGRRREGKKRCGRVRGDVVKWR